MAISFDAIAIGTATSTSVTFSHTCSGADRVLICAVTSEGGTTGVITGVTYNGVSMTLINSIIIKSTVEILYYYLLTPATGANNVVISASASRNIHGLTSSYTGVKQTGFPDSQASSGPVGASTSMSQATTVVASNCWLVGFGWNDVGDMVAGSGTYERNGYAPGVNFAIFDSNGTVGTGSQALACSWSGSSDFNGLMVASMAPVATNNSNFFMFM